MVETLASPCCSVCEERTNGGHRLKESGTLVCDRCWMRVKQDLQQVLKWLWKEGEISEVCDDIIIWKGN